MSFKIKYLILISGSLFLISLLITSITAQAADTKGRFALHGIGAETCSQFQDNMAKHGAETKPVAMAWMTGYLSALNRVNKDTYDVTPIISPESLIDLVMIICAKNPNARVEQAADGLLKSLAPIHVTSESPMIALESDAGKLEIHRETFIAVEDALIRKKYYKGRPEDQLTPPLTAAFKAYQKDQKLKETGLPDAETVLRLLLEGEDRPAAKKNR